MNWMNANGFFPCMVKMEKKYLIGILILFMTLPACTAVNTFPMIARAGDTVSVMVGGSEKARKDTVAVSLQDVNGQTWDLKAMGLVRSVFNLRMDGRADGLHYSPYLDSDISWIMGHEPVQTVLVADLPTNVASGKAVLTISLNAGNDNSSGIADPFTVKLDVVPGSGSSDQFLRKDSLSGTKIPAELGKLEPAPHAKISFGSGTVIGAASLRISFNSAVLNGNDINVYTPESTVRTSAFGSTQRMVYWRQDSQNLYIDIVAPQGINGKYLQLFVIHPKGLSGTPAFALTDAKIYGIDGTLLSASPSLLYFP